jgi:NTE family protein
MIDNTSNIFYSKLLRDNLKNIFGDFDEAILNDIENQLIWLELEGGKILLKEGDEGDSLYFVLSGRLAATKKDDKGNEKKIGEVIRGETVGEMAIFTGEKRYASIIAIRDSVLVQLSKQLFEKVISAYPDVALNVTRLIIERFKNNQVKKTQNNAVNLCFIPIHDTINFETIINQVYDYLSKEENTFFVDEVVVEKSGYLIAKDENTELATVENKKLIQWLNNLEAQHDFMFFSCKATSSSNWVNKCSRQADHIVLIADASQSYDLQDIEDQVLKLTNINISLALVHPSDTILPRGTIKWLNARPSVNQHFHIRQGSSKDLFRMARILTGNATGLVLAGGGAKGFAHIGVYKALEEYKIHIDYIGGTSIGSMMGAIIALDIPSQKVAEFAKKGTLHKPSSDLSFFPFISLVKGGNIKRMVKDTFENFCGRPDSDLSDTWIPLYVVASNYTKSEQTTFFKGGLAKILLASAAIPGVFPPVIINGEIYVDGGTFNNFPADIMRKLPMKKVIGVDFMLDKIRQLTLEDMPSNMDILKSKFVGRLRNKFSVPGIGSIIINSTLMYSNAKRHETKNYLDLHFNPDVSKYGLTAWKNFEKIFEKGYLNAIEVLESMSDEELKDYRN